MRISILGHLLAILLSYLSSYVAYLIFGIDVTAIVGTAFRATIVVSRSFLVWVIGIGIGTRGNFGETFYFTYSPIQSLGFLLLVLGIVVYTKASEYSAPAQRAPAGYARLPDVLDDVSDGDRVSPRVVASLA